MISLIAVLYGQSVSLCKTAWHYGRRFAILRFIIRLVLGVVSRFSQLKNRRQDSVRDIPEVVISTEDHFTSAHSNSGVGVVQSKRLNTEEEDDEFNRDEYIIENTDPLYCEYDSTWETSTTTSETYHRFYDYSFIRFQNAAKDMQNFRHDYPNKCKMAVRKVDRMPNLDFYLDKMPSVPDRVYISQFHKQWIGKYDKLERVHSYIQWLFPLQEPGVNYEASVLSTAEIIDFNNNEEAKINLKESYKLMLNFYGIKMVNETTGKVTRAPHWQSRFENLNRNTHNSLRITRILKCLGTLGFPHYQAPLVRFFLKETLVHGNLPNVKESVLNYFLFAVLDRKRRRRLVKYAYHHYEPKEKFVWCPKRIQNVWSQAQASAPASPPVEMQTGVGGVKKVGTASASSGSRGQGRKQHQARRKARPAANRNQGPPSSWPLGSLSTDPEKEPLSQAAPSSWEDWYHSWPSVDRGVDDQGAEIDVLSATTEGQSSRERGGKDCLSAEELQGT